LDSRHKIPSGLPSHDKLYVDNQKGLTGILIVLFGNSHIL